MKAVRNSCEHGLGEVAGRIPGHECAVAGPGRGCGKGEERTCGSAIHPGSDGGIGTKPVDMSKENHILKPVRIPDNMGGFAVTGGDIDGDEQGAGVTSRCGIPTRAVRGQPGGFCKNLKRDRVKSRPRIDRLGPSDARPREGNRKTNENYKNVNEQSPLPPALILLWEASRQGQESHGSRQGSVKPVFWLPSRHRRHLDYWSRDLSVVETTRISRLFQREPVAATSENGAACK
jgi:hypothetical protein